MNNLYIMCGPPGSGKTTYAKKYLAEKAKYISRDVVRFSLLQIGDEYFTHETTVFAQFVYMISEELKSGHSVIADATHLNKKSRAKLTKAIDQYFKDYNIIYVPMRTSYEVCCERNDKREGKAIVPHDVIKDMYNKYTLPKETEDERCIGILMPDEGSNENE